MLLAEKCIYILGLGYPLIDNLTWPPGCVINAIIVLFGVASRLRQH